MLNFNIFPRALIVLSLMVGQAYAQDVTSTLSYDPEGLNNDLSLQMLTAKTRTVSDENVADAKSSDYYSQGYFGHNYGSGFMNLSAHTEADGFMNSLVNLHLGGVASASSVWHTSFVNGLAPMSYSMNIDIINGFVRLGGWTSSTGGRNMQGGFFADVSANGVSVWNSSQTLVLTGLDASITQTGYDIGHGAISYVPKTDNSEQEAEYTSNAFFGAINLGSFAAGQAIDVTYTLTSFARWEDPHGCAYECGYVIAGIEDPLSISGGGNNVPRITANVTSVPEPETYAMFLAGLGVMGAVALRRKAKQA